MKIAVQFAKEADVVSNIFTELGCFNCEDKKNIIDIFRELLSIKLHPNPLAKGLALNADKTIEEIFLKFGASKMSNYYADVLKLMASKANLLPHFLNSRVLQTLATFISNDVFEISSAALSVFISILFPEGRSLQSEVKNSCFNSSHN